MKLSHLKGGTGTIVKHSNRELFELYIREIAKHKPLSREEENETFKIIKETKDPLAIEKIWKHNLLFVISVARKYAAALNSSVITMEDLVTDGNIGLYNAIERFDHTQGYKFISYAVWYIRQQILISIGKNINSIKLPPNIKTELRKLNKKREVLEQERGINLSTLEVFEIMLANGEIKGFDNAVKLEEMLNLNQVEKSLNTKVGEEDQIELVDLIADESPSTIDTLIRNERKDLASKLLNEVPLHVSDYIKDYFGFENNKPLNYAEIAKKYNKDANYVRNIVEKHLSWLRRKNKKSKEYFFPTTSQEMRRKDELNDIVIRENSRTTFKKGSQGNTDYLIII